MPLLVLRSALLPGRRSRCTLFPYTTLFRSVRAAVTHEAVGARAALRVLHVAQDVVALALLAVVLGEDRKSTRLNSSHRCISYAVFCLKKKIARAALFAKAAASTLPEGLKSI